MRSKLPYSLFTSDAFNLTSKFREIHFLHLSLGFPSGN
ncbi:hypothetical protein D2M30_2852 [Bacillus amyloliquefaciens]|nr:hypothetical protein D2M30_2852 [Bacillus amyloliquefaciens]